MSRRRRPGQPTLPARRAASASHTRSDAARDHTASHTRHRAHSRQALPAPALNVRAVWTSDGRRMVRWSPRSRRMLASALPRLTSALRPLLSRSCSHRKGCGGIKGAVLRIQRSLPRARYVARFDVAAYYNSIRHDRMLGLLGEAQLPEADLALLRDYLALPDTRGTGRGLVASGSLSPLLGALYLAPLDHAMALRMRRGQLVSYVRYMDCIPSAEVGHTGARS